MKKINIYIAIFMIHVPFCAYTMQKDGGGTPTTPRDVSISMTQAGVAKKTISHRSQLQDIVTRMQELQGMVQDLTTELSKAENMSSMTPKTPASDIKGDKKKGKDTPSSAHAPKMYSESEVLEYAASLNPTLAQFAKEHKLPLSQVKCFEQLLQEFHFKPQGMADIMNQFHGTDQTTGNHQKKAYQNMEKNNPEEYLQLALSVFKALDGSGDLGVEKKASPLSTAHVGVQNDIIASQDDTIFKGKIAIFLHALVTIGGIIWAIYGQVQASRGGSAG